MLNTGPSTLEVGIAITANLIYAIFLVCFSQNLYPVLLKETVHAREVSVFHCLLLCGFMASFPSHGSKLFISFCTFCPAQVNPWICLRDEL